MKKVLFVMPNLDGGGAEKVLVDILNNIDKSKFHITLLVFTKTGVYVDKVSHDIRFISMKEKLRIVPGRLWYRFFMKFPKIFYKMIIRENYDTEVAFMEGLATKFIANSTNKYSKKIAWVHCDLFSHHWTDYIFNEEEEQYIYNKFNEIIFVSNDSRAGFEKLYPKNNLSKKVIYNPIISEDIIQKSKDMNIENSEFTIVSVGRLSKEKGYDRLIKAHSQLVKDNPHKLVLIGEGNQREILEKMIKELNVEKTVELKGFVNNPYPYIKCADVFISSSKTEGYSLVIAESIILEKCIIATKISGASELLDNGKYGMMCDNSYEGIRNALQNILENKNLVNKYSMLSQKRKAFLDYNKIINQIADSL